MQLTKELDLMREKITFWDSASHSALKTVYTLTTLKLTKHSVIIPFTNQINQFAVPYHMAYFINKQFKQDYEKDCRQKTNLVS